MKKLVEKTGEGLERLIGERVTFFCINYIYTGKLMGVNETCCLLTDCGIVYETGAFSESQWQDYQKLPHDIYIKLQSIESFGIMK